MICDRFRPRLALLVGNDLDSREASEVRQHLFGCRACQAQWEALQISTGALRSVSRQSPTSGNGIPHGNPHGGQVSHSGSLWPRIHAQLVRQPVPLAESAPSWFTVGAFTAACAAIMWLTLSTPVFDFESQELAIGDLQVAPPRDVAKPASGRFPALHLIDDAQPPVQIYPAGDISQQLVAPPSSFGDPRSF